MITKRSFIKFLLAGAGASALAVSSALAEKIEKLVLSKEEWKKRLTDKQYYILRRAGTEHAHSSPLNNEKRKGIYHCVGCDLALFKSETKFDSGTGWPSFYDVIPGAVETKTDYVLIYPRTEYHCTRCGGHHGHVFKDGPKPTGLRYCNNGIALKFKPEEKQS
ncbi:MAG: peptide-methionine (R)-S-oxide reductase MsrB [Methyloligellaceae bacterium]